jgi:formamidopyrimidine-DNA glycosylase
MVILDFLAYPLCSWGLIITEVILNRKDLRYPIPESALNHLLGLNSKGALSVGRVGKYLEWNVLGVPRFYWHLGMSGHFNFYLLDQLDPLKNSSSAKKFGRKHEHILICGRTTQNRFAVLAYEDPRRFGFVLTAEQFRKQIFPRLGVDPLASDWCEAYLRHFLKVSKRPVKSLLMDESIVTGIGNIYASEICFRAKVRPHKPSCRVSKREIHLLIEQSKVVLESAIRAGGSSIQSYKRIFEESQSGLLAPSDCFYERNKPREGYQSQHLVYNREGRRCLNCGHLVKRKVLSGRSTFWCSSCQR